MRKQIFQLLEKAVEKTVSENPEIYENWLANDSLSHLKIKDKALHEAMKATGGAVNPSLIRSLIELEFS